ncbi:alginate export family protein [Asticcacaulis sp. ZE23SCel15]|uniref:alginate export family protein n=1 Tax=Asticcacaulis sp. ZE23SCel15 TaxID=3059027 RepID=UPI00265DD3DB|nr:alginate export family protein [Asticcacaulis sp. ZE23SCel15]WKL57660.1 alginate export family protein [Asticcacaulis sp. ZE23SCel15]
MFRRFLLTAAAFTATYVPASAQTFSEALAASKPILESRLRSETNDQAGLQKAEALTWRNRIGFQSGEFNKLKLLVEFEDVRALKDDYNSGTNGKTTYAGVGDPEGTELNRLQLTWTPNKAATFIAGRQRIVLDDGRFVGNSGWRQDEQTFDAVRADVKQGKWAVTYAYVSKVNRTQAEAADWDSDSHLINVAYAYSPALKVQVYDYALDFDGAPANSTNTLGARLSGEKALSGVKLTYAAHYASQKDYGNNPADFDLNSYGFDGGVTHGIATLRVGYESLEGNGVRGFITPIASNHGFRGWADAFSTAGNKTMPAGLVDRNIGIVLTPKSPVTFFKKPALTLIYREFETETTGLAVGSEWDAMATTDLTKNLSLMLKYADFERDGPPMPASRTKVWVALEYKL